MMIHVECMHLTKDHKRFIKLHWQHLVQTVVD